MCYYLTDDLLLGLFLDGTDVRARVFGSEGGCVRLLYQLLLMLMVLGEVRVWVLLVVWVMMRDGAGTV